MRNTLQRLRSEEFSSRDFGLGPNLRYLRPKTPHFPETVLGPGEVDGEEAGREEEDKI